LITTLALLNAEAKLLLPAWVAVNAQVPTPTTVSSLPATLQIVPALLVLKVKAVRPLDAVAVRVIGPTPKPTGVAGAKVTVCAPGAIVNAKAALPVPPLASVTVTVKLNAPPAVGEPESSPAEESVKPPGSAPVTVKVSAPAPPLAAMLWL